MNRSFSIVPPGAFRVQGGLLRCAFGWTGSTGVVDLRTAAPTQATFLPSPTA